MLKDPTLLDLPGIVSVYDGGYSWVCMFCKSEGKSVGSSVRKMKEGITTNGWKHLNEKHNGDMVAAEEKKKVVEVNTHRFHKHFRHVLLLIETYLMCRCFLFTK